MKKVSYYSRKERRTIRLGYLWFFGSIASIFLFPAVAFCVCNLLNLEPKTQILFAYLTLGITMFCVGAYDIIGTLLEFKHILVSSLLSLHTLFPNINPKRNWTKSEKRDYIIIGIVFVFLGVAIITTFTLFQVGILKSR